MAAKSDEGGHPQSEAAFKSEGSLRETDLEACGWPPEAQHPWQDGNGAILDGDRSLDARRCGFRKLLQTCRLKDPLELRQLLVAVLRQETHDPPVVQQRAEIRSWNDCSGLSLACQPKKWSS